MLRNNAMLADAHISSLAYLCCPAQHYRVVYVDLILYGCPFVGEGGGGNEIHIYCPRSVPRGKKTLRYSKHYYQILWCINGKAPKVKYIPYLFELAPNLELAPTSNKRPS